MNAVDVAIVGAGIHGAGLAQAAAAAGHSVLLFEQDQIAAGTSSRSSKLIHGGLRYLETGQFHLVRESLHERTLMLKLAPELVQLRRFYVPLYRHTRRRPWQLTLGLSLYAVLAGFAHGAAFGCVPRRRWETLDGLATENLQRVFHYQDAQTDDRALTRAVVASAQSLGATLLCPARCEGAALLADAVLLRYRQADGREQECRARVLVNAAGPWADEFARHITPAIAVPSVERVQGSHLVLPLQLHEGCYYLESPRDGRAIFVLPWRGQVLLGTTETRPHGDAAHPHPSAAEVSYLLGVLKHYFPAWRRLAPADVRESFAGLRVLPRGAAHAFHRSRETLLMTDRPHSPRVLSIYGGKLTTWRAVSERGLGRIAASLPARQPRARTDQLRLQPVPGDA